MTRIGSFAQSQAILAELTKANERTFKTQLQISTGKVAQQYRDIPSQTGVLLSAKRVQTRTEQYQAVGTELTNKLDQQNVILEQTASTAGDLRQSILDSVSTESGAALMEQVQSAFRNALSSLNTKFDGKYMFAGSRTDTAPVNISNLNDLTLVGSVSSVFTNDQQRQSVEIEAGHAFDYNFLADEVGTELMDSLKRIADFNAGPNGPFSQHLTTAQRDFLTTEANNLGIVTQNLNNLVARNGQYSNEVDAASERLDQTKTFMKGFISDIEDVDMAQAVTNLNQDQLVTEATAKLISSLHKMSLLDFI